MKKIIGILGVAVIAAAMFFSANTVNGSSTDLNLASLISMYSANAETSGKTTCYSTIEIGNDFAISRCGAVCVSQQCKRYFDPGFCP